MAQLPHFTHSFLHPNISVFGLKQKLVFIKHSDVNKNILIHKAVDADLKVKRGEGVRQRRRG